MKREDQPPEQRHGPDPEETFEPYEEPKRIPLPVYWIAIALGLWGIIMLYDNSQSVRIGQVQRSERIAELPSHDPASGAALFEARCATCHQPNGSGIRNAVPPLDGSPFVAARAELIVQILLNGIQGPVAVNGAVYDGNMPNFSSVMSDAEIASVASYVRGAWSNRAGPVSPALVQQQRARASRRSGSWASGAQLVAAVGVAGFPPQPGAAPARAPSGPDPAIAILIRQGRDGSWACASCHGPAGQGSLTVPRLAGLNQDYIFKQLRDFVRGARRNETMETVARTLSQDEMRRLGQYYAALAAPSTARPDLGGEVAGGERLALEGDWAKNIPACFSCHGSSGFGVGGRFPALAAQHPGYTVAQLNAWLGGTRKNSTQGLMEGIAGRLTDEDRRAVSDYFATLPPTPARTGSTRGD